MNPFATLATLPVSAINALTAQNDELAALVNRCEDLSDLQAAERVFRSYADLWSALGYGYKVDEARQRIVSRARALAASERQQAAECKPREYVYRNKCATRATLLEGYANGL